jgi:hypothetical protein
VRNQIAPDERVVTLGGYSFVLPGGAAATLLTRREVAARRPCQEVRPAGGGAWPDCLRILLVRGPLELPVRRVVRLVDVVPAEDGWGPYHLPTPEENEAALAKLATLMEEAGSQPELPDDELYANMNALKADLMAAAE